MFHNISGAVVFGLPRNTPNLPPPAQGQGALRDDERKD